MPDLRLEPAPVSDTVTDGIRVEVLSRYSQENSKPGQNQWVFEYTVRITNNSAETAQLVSRHWYITDAVGQTREVEGQGVVGQQPVLAPGQSFKYSSWCPLPTPTGTMRGTYRMATAEGREFDVEIGPFGLRDRAVVH